VRSLGQSADRVGTQGATLAFSFPGCGWETLGNEDYPATEKSVSPFVMAKPLS
jgi:hypothetical protein